MKKNNNRKGKQRQIKIKKTLWNIKKTKQKMKIEIFKEFLKNAKKKRHRKY